MNVYECHPSYLVGSQSGYFFTSRKKKRGLEVNRATEGGKWVLQGPTSKEVIGSKGIIVGKKNVLKFCPINQTRVKKAEHEWHMYEYLPPESSDKIFTDRVICKIFYKVGIKVSKEMSLAGLASTASNFCKSLGCQGSGLSIIKGTTVGLKSNAGGPELNSLVVPAVDTYGSRRNLHAHLGSYSGRQGPSPEDDCTIDKYNWSRLQCNTQPVHNQLTVSTSGKYHSRGISDEELHSDSRKHVYGPAEAELAMPTFEKHCSRGIEGTELGPYRRRNFAGPSQEEETAVGKFSWVETQNNAGPDHLLAVSTAEMYCLRDIESRECGSYSRRKFSGPSQAKDTALDKYGWVEDRSNAGSNQYPFAVSNTVRNYSRGIEDEEDSSYRRRKVSGPSNAEGSAVDNYSWVGTRSSAGLAQNALAVPTTGRSGGTLQEILQPPWKSNSSAEASLGLGRQCIAEEPTTLHRIVSRGNCTDFNDLQLPPIEAWSESNAGPEHSFEVSTAEKSCLRHRESRECGSYRRKLSGPSQAKDTAHDKFRWVQDRSNAGSDQYPFAVSTSVRNCSRGIEDAEDGSYRRREFTGPSNAEGSAVDNISWVGTLSSAGLAQNALALPTAGRSGGTLQEILQPPWKYNLSAEASLGLGRQCSEEPTTLHRIVSRETYTDFNDMQLPPVEAWPESNAAILPVADVEQPTAEARTEYNTALIHVALEKHPPIVSPFGEFDVPESNFVPEQRSYCGMEVGAYSVGKAGDGLSECNLDSLAGVGTSNLAGGFNGTDVGSDWANYLLDDIAGASGGESNLVGRTGFNGTDIGFDWVNNLLDDNAGASGGELNLVGRTEVTSSVSGNVGSVVSDCGVNAQLTEHAEDVSNLAGGLEWVSQYLQSDEANNSVAGVSEHAVGDASGDCRNSFCF